MIKRILGLMALRGTWIPLGTYHHEGIYYLVMARKGITGMLTFKTRRMTRYYTCAEGFEPPILNVVVQWAILTTYSPTPGLEEK